MVGLGREGDKRWGQGLIRRGQSTVVNEVNKLNVKPFTQGKLRPEKNKEKDSGLR